MNLHMYRTHISIRHFRTLH